MGELLHKREKKKLYYTRRKKAVLYNLSNFDNN